VWILRRTPEMVAKLQGHDQSPRRSRIEGLAPARLREGPGRSIKPEVFVAEGVCTHLGCSPTLKKEIGAASDMGADWPGGYYCPATTRASTFAARVFKGSPAPSNLTVPPHRYASETSLVIGEDTKGA
jgi:ubiquinol-cytochrome c reductase iron-sulfur subunit